MLKSPDMDDAGEPREGSGDNREQSRQPIELKVEYKRLNSFFSDYTKNISKGGTFIKTSKPLDVGTEFIFKLYIPKLDEPLRIVGRIQWVVTQEELDAGSRMGPGEPGMGIRFVYREDDEQAEIEHRVQRIMVDSLGPHLYTKLMEQSKTTVAATEGPGLFAGQSETFSSPQTPQNDAFGALMRRKARE